MQQTGDDWILGRQAMFLVDQGLEDPNSSTVSADGKWDLAPTHVQALSARYNAQVNGYGDATSPPSGTVPRVVYAAYADMSRQMLGPVSTTPGITSILEDLSSASNYRTRAYEYSYLAERLWANDSPQLIANNIYGIASWQIAQQHPIFMAHCSDFIVEFAADISTGTGTTVNPDGQIDVDNNDQIKWYSYWFNNPAQGKRNPVNPTGPALAYDPDEPTVYEPPTGWAPYDNSVSAPHNANASGAFVFQHDDAEPWNKATPNPGTVSKWPYLIRIRYRMHDGRGVIESGVNQHGMWFEHVIKVNRP